MHNGKVYCHLTNGSKAWAVRNARMQICKLCHDDIGHLGVAKDVGSHRKMEDLIVIEQFNDVTGS